MRFWCYLREFLLFRWLFGGNHNRERCDGSDDSAGQQFYTGDCLTDTNPLLNYPWRHHNDYSSVDDHYDDLDYDVDFDFDSNDHFMNDFYEDQDDFDIFDDY